MIDCTLRATVALARLPFCTGIVTALARDGSVVLRASVSHARRR